MTTVTKTDIKDLKEHYGVDAVSSIEQTLVNELSNEISNQIVTQVKNESINQINEEKIKKAEERYNKLNAILDE